MGNIKFAHIVTPWDEEIKNILQRLTKDRVAYTKNHGIASDFSRRYPELIDTDMIDVVTTRYRRKPQKTIFILSPGVVSIPKKQKFSFHKIF